MVDKILDTIKSVTSDAITGTAKFTANAVVGTAKLTSDAVVGTAKLTADAVAGTARLTSDAVVGTAKLTTHAIAGTAKFTANAVSETAKFTANAVSETAKFTAGVAGSTMQILNPTDWLIGFARQYLVSYFIHDEPVETSTQRLERNSIYAATVFTVYPMERIRLLIQSQHLYKENSLKYFGAFDCFFKEFRDKGLRVMWRGISPWLPYQMLYYNLLDFRIKTIFDIGKNSGTINDSKVSFEDFCKKFVNIYFLDLALLTGSHPMEVLFAKIGCNPYRPRELRYSLYASYAFCNPVKLYQGYFPGLIMQNLNYLLITPYMYYVALQAYDQLEILLYIVAGMFGVEFLTYPLDLIKRRIIIQNCGDYAEYKYKSVINCISKIYREENVSGFYKGAYLKLINFGARKIIFLTGLSYCNEYTKDK